MNNEKIFVTKAFLPPFEEFVELIKPLWESRRITNMGENHKRLEIALCEYLKVTNISLFTNGHMALELLLQALNIKGEVITTPYTFASTAHAIVRNGLQPVFCDIKEDDFTIDETKIEGLINENTVAILPVHVYGHPCNNAVLEEIASKYGLKLIYDAAHAFGVEEDGKSIVSYGDASMLSFHATKVFNTIEGGAVVYRDVKLGEKMYGLKNFGIRSEEIVDDIGANAKMDEFRSIMGLCNIKYMDYVIKKRKEIYEKYLRNLENVSGISMYTVPLNLKYNYAYFPLYVDEEKYGKGIRNRLYDFLKEKNIIPRKYFYPLITDMDCYRSFYNSENTPIAKKIADGIITLPLYAELELEKVDEITEYIKECLAI